MAHFAKIGLESKVISTLVVSDDDIRNADGIEDESVGQQFLERIFGWPACYWIKTSYNTFEGKYWIWNESGKLLGPDQSKAFRGNYGTRGMIWDSVNNIFIHPKPHNSWTLDILNAKWVSPAGEKPSLTEEQKNQNKIGIEYYWAYDWDEINRRWNLINKLS